MKINKKQLTEIVKKLILEVQRDGEVTNKIKNIFNPDSADELTINMDNIKTDAPEKFIKKLFINALDLKLQNFQTKNLLKDNPEKENISAIIFGKFNLTNEDGDVFKDISFRRGDGSSLEDNVSLPVFYAYNNIIMHVDLVNSLIYSSDKKLLERAKELLSTNIKEIENVDFEVLDLSSIGGITAFIPQRHVKRKEPGERKMKPFVGLKPQKKYSAGRATMHTNFGRGIIKSAKRTNKLDKDGSGKNYYEVLVSFSDNKTRKFYVLEKD